MKLKNQLIIVIAPLLKDYPRDSVAQFTLHLARENEVVILHRTSLIPLWRIIVNKNAWRMLLRIFKTKNLPLVHFIPIGFLPLQRFSLIYKINRFLAWLNFYLLLKKKAENQRPILWVFSSTFGYSSRFHYSRGQFKEKLCIYDCIKQPGSLDEKVDKLIKKSEAEFMRKADLILANSMDLFKKKKSFCPQTYRVPMAKEAKLNVVKKIFEKNF